MVDIFSSMLRTAAPILLAALGGLLCEKAGVLNLALEGMMLFGAFFGVMGSYYTNNAYVGALIAMVTGAVLGMIYTLFVEHWKADAMITSIGMNSLAVGMTSFLKRSIFGDSGIIMGIAGIPKHNSSFLSSIPVIGKILDGQTTLVYVGLILVIVLHFFLFRTHAGINLRAVGERPLAAASAGISVAKYRFLALTVGGARSGRRPSFAGLCHHVLGEHDRRTRLLCLHLRGLRPGKSPAGYAGQLHLRPGGKPLLSAAKHRHSQPDHSDGPVRLYHSGPHFPQLQSQKEPFGCIRQTPGKTGQKRSRRDQINTLC